MGDEALRNKVISNLRACLLSAKGGVSFSELNSDYRKIVGESIPLRRLGYPSLDEFLGDVDGLVISRKGGDWNVAAKPTEETIHLTKLIARQKSAPKRRSRGPAVRHRRPTAGMWKRPVNFQHNCTSRNSSRDYHGNHRPSQSHRSPTIMPLMSIPLKKPISSQFEKPPRYMVPNSGTPQSSPSKRLNDRMTNGSQATTSSNNQTPVIAYKNKTSVQTALNERTTQHTSTPLSSPLLPTPRPGSSKENSTPLKSLSERLKVKVQAVPKPQSQILSPLSPSLLVDNARNTSSPNRRQGPTTPVKNEAPTVTWPLSSQNLDPCKQLEILAQAMKLPEPEYKVAPWDQKRAQKYYLCQVKVGTDSYSSYPEEITSPDEARRVVATKAVKAILLKTGSVSGLLETTNKNLVKERIIAIVAEHQNGVFMHQIQNYYKEQYRENLPEDWEKIIEECSDIFKEKGADDSTILCPYIARSDVSAPEITPDVLSPRLEKIQLSPIGPVVPEILKPPAEPYWDVNITSVSSTADIWARLIGEEYSEKFEFMLNEMESYYRRSAPASGSADIELWSYYAVQEEDSWHRVQCFEFDPRSGKVGVFFIDHGDEEVFHYSKLFPLEKRFCVVPAQAVNLCLADLEEFSDCCEVLEYLEDLLLGNTFVADVVSRENLEEEGWIASVVLYDTKNALDINLNDILLQKIAKNILLPKLNQDGQVSEVYVSHCTESGDVYLQVKSENLRHLANLMNKLIQSGLTAEDVKRSEPKEIVSGTIYLARCFEDGCWYRGIVTSTAANNQIKVFLVDMGKTILVDKKIHLLDLDQLSKVLAMYPHQAIKVKLHNIPESMFNAEMAIKLAALAPSRDVLLVKVVTPASKLLPPVVELFKRVEPDNLLVSINHTLAIDPELIGSNGDGNNNTRPRKRLERTISRHGTPGDGETTKNLKPPRIPPFGEYFDVHITMAANPGNFTVQPYDDRVNLEAMMVQLQEVCVNYKGPILSYESIKEGSLYAAKHIDSHYYRVCISKILDDQIVSVYFCDFGDVSVLTLDKLQPLGRQFLELPYQAIRARLVGVQPLNIDWSVEDCLRFQELVVERNFVSIVVESGPDRLSPGDTVLGLKLIDVSGNTDVYIDKLLIAEGRATAIEG